MTATGTLYVVATPLGNLQDITPRAIEALSHAHIVACEDTRRTGRLLQHLGIRPARLISCHKFNERRRIDGILDALRRGEDVALVSDSGTPGLSDPGALVIGEALDVGLRVSPVPGPSAVSAAFSVAGFPATGFLFVGFLPVKGASRRKALSQLRGESRPMVLFEAPHRMVRTVADLLEAIGDRVVTVIREATKLHEEVYRTTLDGLAQRLVKSPPRGEFTLVLDAVKKEEDTSVVAATPAQLRSRYQRLLAEGVDRREALKMVIHETGLNRATVYAAVREQPDGETS